MFKSDFILCLYINLVYCCLCIFCHVGISNIRILENYYNDASKFLNNQHSVNRFNLLLPKGSHPRFLSTQRNLWPFSHPINFSPRPHLNGAFIPINSGPFNYIDLNSPKIHLLNNDKDIFYPSSEMLNPLNPLRPRSRPHQIKFNKPMKEMIDAEQKPGPKSPNKAIALSSDLYNNKHKYKKRRRPKNQVKPSQIQNDPNDENQQKKKKRKKQYIIDDPNHFPHQYAIEIRWKNPEKNQVDLDAPAGDYGAREMHNSMGLEDAKYRLYEHKEEEHWHQKKWLNEGLKKAYMNGKSIPMIIKQPVVDEGTRGDVSPLPIYAQPMPDGSTLDEINAHFAIPTPSFRINGHFIEWAENDIDFNKNDVRFLPVFG